MALVVLLSLAPGPRRVGIDNINILTVILLSTSGWLPLSGIKILLLFLITLFLLLVAVLVLVILIGVVLYSALVLVLAPPAPEGWDRYTSSSTGTQLQLLPPVGNHYTRG